MAPSSTFQTALALVLRHEGGFVHHLDDPGGATNFGITRETLSRARGVAATVEDVRRLSRTEAAEIYRSLYWEVIRADELPPWLQLALFDFAVHSGPRRAVAVLQKVLDVEADGRPGPVTMAAIRAADPSETIRRLTRERLGFLSRLSTWPVFGRGWRRRVLAVEQDAIRLASSSTPSTGKSVMFDTKTVFASRTVWANLIGFAALILGMFGYDTSTVDAGLFQEALMQFVAAGSFIASTVFRILATKQLAS